MRIAVIGATGGVGQHVVRQALGMGHEVVAFARSPQKLEVEGEGLSIVQGDILDVDSVEQAVMGADAVVNAVGLTGDQDPEVFGKGMRHVVRAMETHGVKRLVSIAGAGLEIEGDPSDLFRRFMQFLLKLFAGDVLRATELQWQVIRDSDLDWVLVRPPRLTDGQPTGWVKASVEHVPGKARIARADVAGFMLEQIASGEWVGKAPFVGSA